jgi:dynein heavy chain, axonemal
VAIDKRVTEKEEFREIENLYHSIKKMINEYEGTRKTNWDGVSKVNSGDKQKDYILVKKGELLQINFDPQLLQLLKEIKYLKILNLQIPSEAEEVFAKNNIFRKNIASLESITGQYNNIILSLNEVEKPIVQEKLKKVEAVLEASFKTITWERTKDIEDFVVKAFNAIGDMASIVDKFKNFVAKIETILREWREKRLFIRPANKIFQANELNEYFVANFEQERSIMASRAKDFINFQDIQGALKSAVSNLSTFKESDKWKNYLHFINSIIINGLREVIQENLLFLFDCLDGNLEPFCSVRLILDNRKLIFEPELNVNENTERMSAQFHVLVLTQEILVIT